MPAEAHRVTTDGIGRASVHLLEAISGFHRGYYRHRHHVENFFGRIKRFRRISTLYDKRSLCFLSFVLFAAILDWLSMQV